MVLSKLSPMAAFQGLCDSVWRVLGMTGKSPLSGCCVVGAVSAAVSALDAHTEHLQG